MRPNINTPCFYYTCLNVKFQEQTIKPVWLSQRFPCRLFILKIMMRFAAGIDMYHAVLNFGEVLFNLFVDVFGNGVGFVQC